MAKAYSFWGFFNSGKLFRLCEILFLKWLLPWLDVIGICDVTSTNSCPAILEVPLYALLLIELPTPVRFVQESEILQE